jgi:hypothetical protein
MLNKYTVGLNRNLKQGPGRDSSRTPSLPRTDDPDGEPSFYNDVEAEITRFYGDRTVADGAEMLDAFEESFPLS